ncbi:uncharacterized protein LOC127871737 isoform X2 [Dreissena polymorpha]|uniref:uncharacterized protein LOC127871737 isoform X2 n=1 Tax=Dreissena polymorpha TaxID=45954 RepID=UPI002263B0E4|nr:uncharacterized protein LOC127871737 isoform X2 [Dreissena polymorpha]
MKINMFYALILFVLLFLCLFGVQGMTRIYCPDEGRSANGFWVFHYKEGAPRCVLKCDEGFEPDGCHVLRRIKPDTWNHEIPHCVNMSEYRLPWKTLAKAGVAVAAGAGAVAAAPVVLSAVGFTSAGVAAGSIAAGLQASVIVVVLKDMKLNLFHLI